MEASELCLQLFIPRNQRIDKRPRCKLESLAGIGDGLQQLWAVKLSASMLIPFSSRPQIC